MITLVYGNAQFYRSYDYMILMLIPYPMAVVATAWMEPEYLSFERLIKRIEVAVIAFTMIMRFVKNWDLHQMHLLIHFLLLFTIGGIIYFAVRTIRHREQQHTFQQKTRIWIGLSILMLASVLDIIRYNMTDKANIDGARFTRLGLLFLMYFMLSQYVLESKMRLRQSLEAEVYRQMAYRDELTGVANRTAFELREKELNERLKNEELTLAIISVDVNHLKKINDTYGHAAGDNYIIASANLLRKVCESYGTIYRIGGDEFAVIMEGSEAEATCQHCIALLHGAATTYRITDTLEAVPSLAIGYDLLTSEDHRNVESAEKIADENMYRNKHDMKAARTD